MYISKRIYIYSTYTAILCEKCEILTHLLTTPCPAGHQPVLSGAEGHISQIIGAGHFDGLA
jgi:hypothetical protein